MSNGRTTVAIFIDALGAEVARSHGFLANAPGVRKPLETVLGYSSAAIPSLLTGTFPREHGHFSMYLRDRGKGVFRPYRPLMRLAQRTRGRGVLRRALKRHLTKRIEGYFELYDIPLDVLAEFDLCQKRDIFKPAGLAPSETFIDRLDRSGVPYRIWTWKDDEHRAVTELLDALSGGTRGFFLLYSARLDALMHAVGTAGRGVGAELDRYARLVEEIRRRASGELHLFLFSDHGMTDVRESHDLHAALGRTGLSTPKDYLVFTDSTMARFWFRSPTAPGRLRSALPPTGWGRWLDQGEMAAYGIDFPDHRYGEAIYLLEPGHVIVPSYMGLRACAAMHGYGPEDVTCKAWFYAAQPADPEPASILDLPALFDREVVWMRGKSVEPAS
jgi:hypothetical protein